MKISLALVALVAVATDAFTASPLMGSTKPSSSWLAANNNNNNEEQQPQMDRRTMLNTAVVAAASGLAVGSSWNVPFAMAEEEAAPAAAASKQPVVVVAGATGQTGRRVLERLASPTSGFTVIGGVRNPDKAQAALSESSTVIRGAMVQQVSSIASDASLSLKHLDVVKDSTAELQTTLSGADALVIAVGFVPGNPLKMNQAAHEVDNVGTCKLIDAAKAAGVKKVVMVSSILTNGRNWGQEKSPGFVITNAFGQVLDEKIVAENYLRASGLDYTIVRPGGLKAKPPSGALFISGEDTLNAGEISRDLVADVCVASLTDAKASKKVLEIIEDEEKPPQVFNGLKM